MSPLHSRPRRQGGFTLLELIVVVGALTILAAIVAPMVLQLIEDSRVSRAQTEARDIATAISSLYKDTARWPVTCENGPSGHTVSRLVGSSRVVTAVASSAGTGAENWGSMGDVKQLGDFLYWNNPDNDSGPDGANANQADQDYPTRGSEAWKGPYLEEYRQEDPWGHAYVVNVRYCPGGVYTGTGRHKVLVISAGPDGLWSTPFADSVTESLQGDDIAHVVHVTN